MPYCARCLKDLAEGTKYCPECGTPTSTGSLEERAIRQQEPGSSRFTDPATGGEPTKKQTIGCLVVAVFILAGVTYAMFSSNDSDEATTPTQPPSPEYMLAALDNNQEFDADSPVVAQYGSALDALEAKCPEGRSRLSDFAVSSRDQLRERGVTESLLTILQNVDDSIPVGTQDGDVGPCLDIFASYVILRSD